jgi:hypothetical protein
VRSPQADHARVGRHAVVVGVVELAPASKEDRAFRPPTCVGGLPRATLRRALGGLAGELKRARGRGHAAFIHGHQDASLGQRVRRREADNAGPDHRDVRPGGHEPPLPVLGALDMSNARNPLEVASQLAACYERFGSGQLWAVPTRPAGSAARALRAPPRLPRRQRAMSERSSLRPSRRHQGGVME